MPIDFARLAADADARRADYLQAAATGSAFPGQGEGLFTQIARLETGIGPVSRPEFEESMNKMDQRLDTADFGANGLIRIAYMHGQNPMIPLDLRQRIERTFLNFKYWLDEPGRDEMGFWSENHQILFATVEYLAGHLYPQAVFPNAGHTGAQHAAKARPRILRWLDHRMRFGFSEWYSPVYYEEDLAPLFNLVDFAPEAEIRERAALVLDLMIFDLARLTNGGSFGVSSGRCYEEHKWTGWNQSVGSLVEILFGTRGRWKSRGSMSANSYASSRYRVPHVLLAIGRDQPPRLTDRSRSGISFGEAAATGLGFQSLEDGMFWWGMGAYTAPETIVLTRRMIAAYDLWHQPYFQLFGQTRAVPDSLLATIASSLSPISEGSVLSTANIVTFRTPHAMLSSIQDYRKGQVGYQQHAWQATLGMDAVVFTTAPGTFGRDGPGEWTGSGSLPRIVQVENVAVLLYNPGIGQRALFPAVTHAFFPRAAFDEVVSQAGWTFARKGDGYVALWSAQGGQWQTAGAFADRELIAAGARNAWICQIGNRAENGPFADFVAAISAASVGASGTGNQDQQTPLSVTYVAPGLGRIDLAWQGAPALNGSPIATNGFPRWGNPYAQVSFGTRAYEIRHGGEFLRHDQDLGTRSGLGL